MVNRKEKRVPASLTSALMPNRSSCSTTTRWPLRTATCRAVSASVCLGDRRTGIEQPKRGVSFYIYFFTSLAEVYAATATAQQISHLGLVAL